MLAPFRRLRPLAAVLLAAFTLVGCGAAEPDEGEGTGEGAAESRAILRKGADASVSPDRHTGEIVEDNLRVIRYRAPNGLLVNLPFADLPAAERERILALREKNTFPRLPLSRAEARRLPRPLIVNKDGIRKREGRDLKTELINATVAGYENHPALTTVVLNPGSRFWETQYRDDTGATASFWPAILNALADAHPASVVDQDPFLLCLEFLKKHRKEVVWSIRVNDTHDHKMPVDQLRGWKKERALTSDADGDPFLVGTNDAPPRFGRPNAFNYANDEVRAKFLSAILAGARKFAAAGQLDGVELDFMRHPLFFKSVADGRRPSAEERALMTGLLRTLRAEFDRIEKDRGRPLFLMIRVPDSVAFCHAAGLDLKTWLDESLVDAVVSPDYYLLTPLHEFARFCHGYNVPYYACLERRRLEKDLPGASKSASMSVPVNPAIWRGEALNAWSAGVDGIYIFNRPSTRADVLQLDLHDPVALARLPADQVQRQTATGPAAPWTSPDRWARNWQKK